MENITNILKKYNIAIPFLAVYLIISAATFYHSAWGFGTLGGPEPGRTEAGELGAWLFWWSVGGLMAVAIDVGMAVIVVALVSGQRRDGRRRDWLIVALVVLALGSALTQVIFSVSHASRLSVGGVRPAWSDASQFLLDLRVFALPLLLPASLLIFAFAAKTYGESESQEEAQPKEAKTVAEPEPERPKTIENAPTPKAKTLEVFRLRPTEEDVLDFLTENGPAAPGELCAVFGDGDRPKAPAFASRHTNRLIDFGLVRKNEAGQFEAIGSNGDGRDH